MPNYIREYIYYPGVSNGSVVRDVSVWPSAVRGGQSMAEVDRIEESTANGVRAGAVVATLSQAVHERESHFNLI